MTRDVSQIGFYKKKYIDYHRTKGNVDLLLNYVFLVFRIVRNKAAEKAKLSGYGTPSPLPQDPGTALGRHPAYSINGILGIHQPDANANLHKRKRDEEGKRRDPLGSSIVGSPWDEGSSVFSDQRWERE